LQALDAGTESVRAGVIGSEAQHNGEGSQSKLVGVILGQDLVEQRDGLIPILVGDVGFGEAELGFKL